MSALARNAIATSDIVVELVDVHKLFRQKQRSEHLSETLRNMLRPRIREVQALRGVNLQIRRGEVVAYAGPNGAGKSTTVKLLSGLLAPDSGSVRSLGMDRSSVALPVTVRQRHESQHCCADHDRLALPIGRSAGPPGERAGLHQGYARSTQG